MPLQHVSTKYDIRVICDGFPKNRHIPGSSTDCHESREITVHLNTNIREILTTWFFDSSNSEVTVRQIKGIGSNDDIRYHSGDLALCPVCAAKRMQHLRLSLDIIDRIRGGAYGSFEYMADNWDQFKEDALVDAGLTGHPKAEKVWTQAREICEGESLNNIVYTLRKLAKLIE